MTNSGIIAIAAAIAIAISTLGPAIGQGLTAKAAMEKMGYCGSFIRSPLTEMEPENKEKLFAIMKGHKLI